MNRIKDYGKLATDITAWIKNYAESNNISSLVVGVSGGVDSAVVSTLCAMTGLPTFLSCISIDNTISCTQRAKRHMEWLQEEYMKVRQQTYYMESVSGLIGDYLGMDNELVWANTKSRLRMVTLYHIAGITNGIVVGTGNKVEDFGIGFFTKYGDGGVDISPIADLYKTEVIELGRHLGISEEILTAAPTDGLFVDGRTDEQQIRCTYEELEWVMNYNDGELNPSPISERQEEVLQIYWKFYNRNRHKMLPIPIFKLNQ